MEITSQIRRAAIFILSDIAEGAARKSSSEFHQFLYIALSGASELNTQFIISNNLGFLGTDNTDKLNSELDSISRRLQGLIKSLKTTTNNCYHSPITTSPITNSP